MSPLGAIGVQSATAADSLLNNREWASLFWLAVIAVFMLSDADRRASVVGVLRAGLQRRLLLTLGAYGLWVWLVMRIAARFGWWTPALTKDTFVWFVTAGLGLLFSFDKAMKEPGFLRRAAKAAITATVFVEGFINLYVLPLLLELVLQPSMVLLVGVGMVARNDQEPAKRLAGCLQAAIGFGLLGYVLLRSVEHWRELDTALLARQFALPVWLTLGVLPIVYGVAVYSGYESAFRRIDWNADVPRRQRRVAKLALLSTFHVKARELSTFGGSWQFRLREAPTFGAARRVVRDFRVSKQAEQRAKEEAEARLLKFTGVKGTDDEGRQLDRREFNGTTEALRWLSTCMMGWYRHHDEYVDDLLERFQDDFTRQGLPRPSGITLRVSHDKQSWYAWRRTITGWVFAIGAAGPPPDEWTYDGPEPPTRIPGEDGHWVSNLSVPTDGNRNWD